MRDNLVVLGIRMHLWLCWTIGLHLSSYKRTPCTLPSRCFRLRRIALVSVQNYKPTKNFGAKEGSGEVGPVNVQRYNQAQPGYLEGVA